MGPGDLAKALAGLPFISDPNLIMGTERNEDAGVYKLTDELAIVQTVDFFTPIVDDPFTFGQIAAVNSLSDVYAKGGKPLTAMNIACFPETMDIHILNRVLAGGLDKMREAGVVLMGGHTVSDPELKYGLSVTGLIHPQKVIRNNGAQVGDKLILTKPLGTGIISTAIKGGVVGEEATRRIIRSMSTLNRRASELMLEAGVHACTDVTGFGLIGHSAEMVDSPGIGMIIDAQSIPIFPEAIEFAGMGLLPGGLHRNREFRQHMVIVDKSVPGYLADIIYDPQTSGGLLMAIAPGKADGLIKKMHAEGIAEAVIIGEFAAEPKGKISVR